VALRVAQGRVVQVDPIKPTLKAPGIKLLKLNHGKHLSNFGFKFNLRRYTKDELRMRTFMCFGMETLMELDIKVRRCRLNR